VKNLQGCLREWARVLDMCEGTDVKPTTCWRYGGGRGIDGRAPTFTVGHVPSFGYDSYNFAIAIVEGKPVFEGDTLHSPGDAFAVSGSDGANLYGQFMGGDVCCFSIGLCSWNPPKKKTFTLNGVDLPVPDFSPEGFSLDDRTTLATLGEAQQVQDALDALFDEGRKTPKGVPTRKSNERGGRGMSELTFEELLDERVRLRAVYEAARRVLRYNGIDKARTIAAVDELDEAIEQVKSLDSGLEDCGDMP